MADKNSLMDQLGRAVGCHQRGDLEGAARLYQAVLAQSPAEVDALHYLGLLEAQRGNAAAGVQLLRRAAGLNPRIEAVHLNLANMLLELGALDEALASVDQALAINAGSALALNSRGLILLEAGRAPEALAAFERALSVAPDYAEALNNRGNALLQLGRAEEALASYERALALNPQSEQVLNNRGNALLELKRHDEAVASFDHALELRPDYAEALHHRGTAKSERREEQAALADIERALQIHPRYPEALNSRGNVLVKLGRLDEALASYDAALAMWPEFVDALGNRGYALLRLGREDEALASCDQALQIDPRNVNGLNNKGNILLDRGAADAALALYERALSIKPDNAVALGNRGNALLALGRSGEALASYEKSLVSDPAAAEINMYAGMCRLLMGDFAGGWAQYESRWQTQFFARWRRDFPAPWWRGDQSLEGKTILLHAEQGFGDTLQFCRYATAVADRGAEVLLEVQPPLKELLASLRGVKRLLCPGEALPAIDYHCPLLSLPRAFGTTLDNLPSAVPYLNADPARIARWKERIGEKKLPRIGLVWSGYRTPGLQHDRTLPLVDLSAVASQPAQFFSLQKDVSAADKAELQRHNIRHCGDELADFADTAALIEVMDLVITIDTAVAHLAGALGKPVWILLRYAADWRWLQNRVDNPWYPSARLFRQPAAGDWTTVMHKMQTQLSLLLAADRNPAG